MMRFAKFNSIVFERYREWMLQVSTRALEASTDEIEHSLGLLCNAGMLLYSSQELYGAAEDLRRSCLEQHTAILGDDYPDTSCSLHNLAGTL
jgi:hypothetical protein